MDGHETWEEMLGGTFGTPEMAYAPPAGRFALSRIVAPNADLMPGVMIPDGATQEMRVYQTESGDLLLKVQTTPVTRFAENFDLSDDGLVAAVVSAGAVEVYKLPPPSAQDMKDLEEARSFSPPQSDAQVRFAKLESAANGGDNVRRRLLMWRLRHRRQRRRTCRLQQERQRPMEDRVGERAVEQRVLWRGRRRPGRLRRVGIRQRGRGVDDGRDGDGDAVAAGRRRPPTLLEPGENVEKVKAPAQQTTQQSSR